MGLERSRELTAELGEVSAGISDTVDAISRRTAGLAGLVRRHLNRPGSVTFDRETLWHVDRELRSILAMLDDQVEVPE